MIDFEILADGPFGPSDLLLRYTAGSSVRRNECMDTMIDALWEARLAASSRQGRNLFDGRLFRLKGFARIGGGLELQLEDTSFREYIGTAPRDFHGRYPDDFLAYPLAVCAALRTSDGRLIVEKRRVFDLYRAQYHVIGGFLERELDADTLGLPDAFAAITREIREELGLETPSGLVCTGLVHNLIVRHPELCFSGSVPEPFDEVAARLNERRSDQEIDQLISVEDSEAGLGDFILTTRNAMVATGKACLLLYGRESFGRAWFDRVMDDLAGP